MDKGLRQVILKARRLIKYRGLHFNLSMCHGIKYICSSYFNNRLSLYGSVGNFITIALGLCQINMQTITLDSTICFFNPPNILINILFHRGIHNKIFELI